MPGIVLTFPILAGKTEAWRRFCQEMAGWRKPMYEASRRRLGITHEEMALMATPFGSKSVTTLEADDIDQTLSQIMTSELPFESWYRDRLAELHGASLTTYAQFAQPAQTAQAQELLFEWNVLDVICS